MPDSAIPTTMATRFRGFLPVVVDVETGGFDPARHPLLEIAAAPIRMDAAGRVYPDPIISAQVQPFAGAEFNPRSLEITGIDPHSALRAAVPEAEALRRVFAPVRKAIKAEGCERAVLVGHNAAFDLAFVNATVKREGLKRNPFHPFSCFDTATLAGLAYGQTVLSKAVNAAGLQFDSHAAHSAVYDTERTAQLFCIIVNRWKALTEATAVPAHD
jgi:ribonuclease T